MIGKYIDLSFHGFIDYVLMFFRTIHKCITTPVYGDRNEVALLCSGLGLAWLGIQTILISKVLIKSLSEMHQSQAVTVTITVTCDSDIDYHSYSHSLSDNHSDSDSYSHSDNHSDSDSHSHRHRLTVTVRVTETITVTMPVKVTHSFYPLLEYVDSLKPALSSIVVEYTTIKVSMMRSFPCEVILP